MKKLLITAIALLLASSAVASNGFEKKGFLTAKSCAEIGAFADCKLEAFVCGAEGCFRSMEPGAKATKVEFVLFVHDEGKYYNLDASSFHMSELDEGISRNDVTIKGEFDKRSNTIVVKGFKAPPPPQKSFFKGCL